MSVAVIQGTSGGIGLPLAQHILKNTSLKLYALTHRSSARDIEDQLSSTIKDAKNRLTVLTDIDVRKESTLERAANIVKEREGKGSVRLIACLAGIVRLPRSPFNLR
jgi:NAD(P)-dependent dehydrogenase (short-subunit alcohol dehydrogenase family)